MKSENSIPEAVSQQSVLSAVAFGGENSNLLSICAGGNIEQGLELAADLAIGVEQLCSRLEQSINFGELAYCSEVRALGFLSGTVAAFIRAAQFGLVAEGGAK